MKTYDSQGRLKGEINTTFMQDGTVIHSASSDKKEE